MLPSQSFIAFSFGILIALLMGNPVVTLVLGILIGLFCVSPLVKTRHIKDIIVWCAFGSLLISCRLLFLEYKSNQHEQQLIQAEPNIEGTITQIGPADHEKFHSIYDIKINIPDHRLKNLLLGSPVVRIYSRKQCNFSIGDLIQILSPIKQKNSPTFSFYKKKIGINATLFDPKIMALEQKHLHSPPHTHSRETVLEKITTKMNPATAIFFSALFLGKHSGHTIFKDMKNTCSYWGVSHMLARSGLHLMIFVALLNFFLSFIPLYFRYKNCFIISALLLYAYLSWSSVSFTRAFLCMLIYHLLAYSHIKTSLLQALFVTGVIILSVNPYQAFFADFQLSFLLTASLAIYSFITKQSTASS